MGCRDCGRVPRGCPHRGMQRGQRVQDRRIQQDHLDLQRGAGNRQGQRNHGDRHGCRRTLSEGGRRQPDRHDQDHLAPRCLRLHHLREITEHNQNRNIRKQHGQPSLGGGVLYPHQGPDHKACEPALPVLRILQQPVHLLQQGRSGSGRPGAHKRERLDGAGRGRADHGQDSSLYGFGHQVHRDRHLRVRPGQGRIPQGD